MGDEALSRRRIAQTAREIVRREGRDAFSARRLAAHLGCKAMSLYHHFGSMDDILDEVVELALEGLAPPARSPKGDPAKAIRLRARRYLAFSLDDPESFRLIATRRWKGAAGAARAGELAALFAAAGVEGRRAVVATRALGAYLNGAGLALAAWRERGEDERPVKNDLYAGLDMLIAALIS